MFNTIEFLQAQFQQHFPGKAVMVQLGVSNGYSVTVLLGGDAVTYYGMLREAKAGQVTFERRIGVGTDTPERIVVALVLGVLFDRKWQEAAQEEVDGVHEKELYSLSINSHVGRECEQLLQYVEGIRTMQMEQRELALIMKAAVSQMAVWLFG